jgi:hypothetical protein
MEALLLHHESGWGVAAGAPRYTWVLLKSKGGIRGRSQPTSMGGKDFKMGEEKWDEVETAECG